MKENSRLWPVDPGYADKIIWDSSVDCAYRYNDVMDALEVQQALYDAEFEKPESDKRNRVLERIAERMDAMQSSQHSLAHVIGICIGYEGLVTQSPYVYEPESNDRGASTSSEVVTYLIDGKIQTIDL